MRGEEKEAAEVTGTERAGSSLRLHIWGLLERQSSWLARPYVLLRHACGRAVHSTLAAGGLLEEQCLKPGGRTVVDCGQVFVGMDASKDRHAVAVADGGCNGEVRFHGEIRSDDSSVRRLVRKLERSGARLRFCYEAGPTGCGLERLIEEFGHECAVIAPSLIPRPPDERVKTTSRSPLTSFRRRYTISALRQPVSSNRRMMSACCASHAEPSVYRSRIRRRRVISSQDWNRVYFLAGLCRMRLAGLASIWPQAMAWSRIYRSSFSGLLAFVPRYVVLLPITHTAPAGDTVGIEIPARVRQAPGLDDAPGWVIVSEHNINEWPDAGLSPLPGLPDAFSYGFIPPGLFAQIRARFLELARAKQSRTVRR